jgi:hypothetical protein
MAIPLIAGSFLLVLNLFSPPSGDPAQASVSDAPPPATGWFRLQPVGAWQSLPGDRQCDALVHHSTWEPRPSNATANHFMFARSRVHGSFRSRPVAVDGSYAPRWDTWLLQRVTGHHTGTTDENIQWAACKWGLPDNLLRAVAVRESTWYQNDTYLGSGRCVQQYGCGDVVQQETPASKVFCAAISRYGYDYRKDYAPATGICPRTFGIVGVMSWQAPSWGPLLNNQNGTFPFNRSSTAFALDYLGSQIRGCYEGWEWWLKNTGTGTYRPGQLWGCVGAWYSGDWRSTGANRYISLVRAAITRHTWLTEEFAHFSPPCDARYGCPRSS